MFTVTRCISYSTTPETEEFRTLDAALKVAGEHDHIEGLVTYAEAVKIVASSKKRAMFIAAGQLAPCATPEKANRAFPLCCNVPVSKPDALQCLKCLYGERMQAEALVRLSFLGRCLFIGRAA
jgi:hypothetical protein